MTRKDSGNPWNMLHSRSVRVFYQSYDPSITGNATLLVEGYFERRYTVDSSDDIEKSTISGQGTLTVNRVKFYRFVNRGFH